MERSQDGGTNENLAFELDREGRRQGTIRDAYLNFDIFDFSQRRGTTRKAQGVLMGCWLWTIVTSMNVYGWTRHMAHG